LSTQHREALFLIIVCGMSYAEAGAVCDCPPGTMKSRVNRARNALAEYLDDWGDVGPDAIALAVQAARNLEQNHLAA
jgi:DNA-directed RNA polymerase specialized sigma24 family protein